MLSPPDTLQAQILIVDDQEANVQLLYRMLSDTGYSHITCTTQAQAVAALHQKNGYDLILLDLQMPDMDGFVVIEALKEVAADGDLPVVALTAQPAHKLRALQAGVKDFISKPFDLREVKSRIHNTLVTRLLYKRLLRHNHVLEQTVRERTDELLQSESRLRGSRQAETDWYWEQFESGNFTQVSGPASGLIGIELPVFLGQINGDSALGWVEADRKWLQAKMAGREPFVGFLFTRTHSDGSQQHFRVSGEPIFDVSGRFTGYRGIGSRCVDSDHSFHAE